MLSRFRLVLVSPEIAGNVGAIARVAANFDLRDLHVVTPLCKWNGPEAKVFAKGPAREYLDRFSEDSNLGEALTGCSAAVGFTRRSGELRRASVSSEELSNLSGKVALVFGREKEGLTRAELLKCTHVCALDAANVMPSLNLSHAVAVVLSRLYSAPAETAADAGGATVDQLEALFEHWRGAMVDAGMVKGGNPERMLAHIRRVIQRANLNTRDVAIFRAFLSKTQVAMGTRKRSTK